MDAIPVPLRLLVLFPDFYALAVDTLSCVTVIFFNKASNPAYTFTATHIRNTFTVFKIVPRSDVKESLLLIAFLRMFADIHRLIFKTRLRGDKIILEYLV